MLISNTIKRTAFEKIDTAGARSVKLKPENMVHKVTLRIKQGCWPMGVSYLVK